MNTTEISVCDFNLVEEVVNKIPYHTWPIVKEATITNIVDAMPSHILKELTGDEQGFEIADKILTSYYEPNDRNKDLIIDAFKILGEENTLYMLDALQLDKVALTVDHHPI